MQICEQLAPREITGAAPCATFSGFGSMQLPSAPKLSEYLHEDLAQTLCAVKIHLEGLAQNPLLRGELAPSIGALQDVNRQVRALAVDIRPLAAGASARAVNARNDAPQLRRVRARSSASMSGTAGVAALAA